MLAGARHGATLTWTSTGACSAVLSAAWNYQRINTASSARHVLCRILLYCMEFTDGILLLQLTNPRMTPRVTTCFKQIHFSPKQPNARP